MKKILFGFAMTFVLMTMLFAVTNVSLAHMYLKHREIKVAEKLPHTFQPSARMGMGVSCPGDKVVLGGGGYTYRMQHHIKMINSLPWGDNGWYVSWHNDSNDTVTVNLRVYAICADEEQ